MSLFDDSPNSQITTAINLKGNVIDYSKDGKLMNDFIKNNRQVNNDLFTFLIENNLNRYLFGVLLRINGLDINNIHFREELLDPDKIENAIQESFIKRFNCKNCDHLIYRKHLNEIKFHKDYELECPNCNKNNFFSYKDMENDFNIKPIDLIKFFNRLIDIGVVDKKLMAICPSCTEKEDFIENKTNLECNSCNILREINYVYSMKFDFFNDKGYWFEWYVYNICNHIYQNVDHNIDVSYVKNGNTKLCELDVVFIDNDDNLVIFECKDYLKSKDKKIRFKEIIDNLRKLVEISDNISFVSSFKEFNKNDQIDAINMLQKDITFIEGIDLENQFLSEDNILEFLRSGNYNAIYLYQKLNDLKKLAIVKEIISEIINNNGENTDRLENMINIFDKSSNVETVLSPERSNLEKTIDICMDNIKNRENVSYSFSYILSLFRAWPELVENSLDINEFIQNGTIYLSPIGLVKHKERAPFYYCICLYFKKVDFESSSLDEGIIKAFLMKFIPMLNLYYAPYSVRNTLTVFEKLWDFVDDSIESALILKILDLYKSDTGYKKRRYLTSFLKDKFDELTPANQIEASNII